ncbi:MAG: hypothetical protein ACR2P0_02245 [Acidimicrobiales bacterium]
MFRRFIGPFAAIILLASVMGVAPAAADAPVFTERFEDSFSFPNEDYSDGCGVPVESALTIRGHFKMYEDGTFRVHENGRIVHTNDDTGEEVYETWAANFAVSEEVTENGPNVTIVEDVTATGVPIKFSAKGIGVIARDAGTITFRNTIVLDFSLPGDPLVSFDQEILSEGGPHPLFDGINEEGPALCDAIGGEVQLP